MSDVIEFDDGIYVNPDVSFGYEGDFYTDNIVRMEVNAQDTVSPFTNLRTNYDDVEEIVDDRYFVPSSAAVTSNSRSYQGLYDSPQSLSDSRVARLNAAIRHPSADPVDVNTRIEQLKLITVEYVDNDKAAAVKAAEKAAAESVNQPPQYQPPKQE